MSAFIKPEDLSDLYNRQGFSEKENIFLYLLGVENEQCSHSNILNGIANELSNKCNRST